VYNFNEVSESLDLMESSDFFSHDNIIKSMEEDDSPREFYATDEYMHRKKVQFIFTFFEGGKKWSYGVECRKTHKKGIYQLDAYRVNTSTGQKLHWRLKKNTHLLPFVAGITRSMEMLLVMFGIQEVKGIISKIPKKSAIKIDKIRRLFKIAIRKHFKTQLAYIDVQETGDNDDGKHYIFVTNKKSSPQDLFYTKAYKNYTFKKGDTSVDADAISDAEPVIGSKSKFNLRRLKKFDIDYSVPIKNDEDLLNKVVNLSKYDVKFSGDGKEDNSEKIEAFQKQLEETDSVTITTLESLEKKEFPYNADEKMYLAKALSFMVAYSLKALQENPVTYGDFEDYLNQRVVVNESFIYKTFLKKGESKLLSATDKNLVNLARTQVILHQLKSKNLLKLGGKGKGNKMFLNFSITGTSDYEVRSVLDVDAYEATNSYWNGGFLKKQVKIKNQDDYYYYHATTEDDKERIFNYFEKLIKKYAGAKATKTYINAIYEKAKTMDENKELLPKPEGDYEMQSYTESTAISFEDLNKATGDTFKKGSINEYDRYSFGYKFQNPPKAWEDKIEFTYNSYEEMRKAE